ncbi:MAG: hypothetical protein QOF68_1890 [Gaiellales bacterium]|jgi:hypothetical protein|nr:hypothetical protein [Gaiellales bacterium]
MIDDRDMEMDDMEATQTVIEIDDRFMSEWVEFGIREMDAYLAKHARFQRFLTERESAV